MDKHVEYLSLLPNDYLHIAKSFATDNNSPKIEPAHLFRALLHKNVGLADYIENVLDSDYYYLMDWADIRVNQAPKSPYPMKETALSSEAKSVVKEAQRLARNLGQDDTDIRFVLAALVSPGVGFSADQLKTLPLTARDILNELGGKENTVSSPGSNVSSKSSVRTNSDEEYIVDLFNELVEEPMLGFDGKIRSMIETLSRKERANIIIVGETGVGKSSLIYSLLQKVRNGEVPSSLKNLHPFELDLIGISQGVSYKGEVEDRFKKILNEIGNHPHSIVVIENFNRIMDKQSLLNGILPILKKQLSKNKLQIILTTTVDGYTKDIEKDKELLSYCEKISVEEPDETLAVEILSSKAPLYSEFHNITLAEGVAADIVRLAKRYMPEKSLPSSAIDLLDRAMASAKVDNELTEGNDAKSELDKEYIRDVVAGMTGLPIGNIQSEEREKLSNAEEIIHRRVVGQNHAVKSIIDAIYESRSGLNKKGQPMGSFFFLGPTGTGKTELAKSLADFLFNDETAMLRFDMSEYKEEHSVALLYGAPPGYVGYEEGGQLTEAVRRKPYSVVLFDEVEKAHPDVFNILLQVLDDGRITDSQGRTVDFKNTVIILTSNLGSDIILNDLEQRRAEGSNELSEDARKQIDLLLKSKFRPEFLNRLDEIVYYKSLTKDETRKIVDLQLEDLRKRMDEGKHLKLDVTTAAKDFIIDSSYDSVYGARPIKRFIQSRVETLIAKAIIQGRYTEGATLTVDYDGTGLVLR